MPPDGVTEGAVVEAVLPVADLTRALAFYERLGFTVQAHWPGNGYAIVTFGPSSLHLTEHPDVDARLSLSGCYLRVADADAIHARWTAAGAREIAPPADQPYGIREFATEDLDGNLWRVGSPLPVTTEPSDVSVDTASAATAAATTPAGTIDEREEVPRGGGGPGTSDDEWLGIVSGGVACAGCGLVAMELPARALGAEVREASHAFGELLRSADDDAVRHRPSPHEWSAIEHGVHVRDVLTVFADRIVRTLRQHEPELGWWDHEAALAGTMAGDADPDAVADDLGRNASLVSEALRLVTDDDWARRATRGGTDEFTIELLARFTLHEVVHHRTDASRALRQR